MGQVARLRDKRGIWCMYFSTQNVVKMWISCNTARPACNFLQALRSQCPPALTSRQVLLCSDTKMKSVFFQISLTVFLLLIT